MSTPDSSRFTSQNKTTQQRISNNTVGLVKLSDFRKRRAEVLEQQEREAREAAVGSSGTGTPAAVPTPPDRSLTGTPDPRGTATDGAAPRPKAKANKKRKIGGAKLSFGDDDEEEGNGTEEDSAGVQAAGKKANGKVPPARDRDSETPEASGKEGGGKIKANASVGFVPRPMTKSALRREAEERELLRREFLVRQEAVKMTEIAIPFVFYDGTNIPGGVVPVKKGDFVWVFLDKSRKVGADLGVGEKTNARREWARVGVDDLMMVRGNIIIPHHYEFLFFIMNKTKGPENKLLFDYSTEPPVSQGLDAGAKVPVEALSTAASRSAKALRDLRGFEGISDDPTFTKVVDRRWYERNKHIYPASVWQEFDPEKDYQNEIRRDTGGNTFFYS
ncbi:XAP5, circadian clock regulator-domain-containing protein [Xylariales sp. PMI_506]|nr:XAP5, circadian clock regulator-domain-containing protein [Xylariales sp. PMI_506]